QYSHFVFALSCLPCDSLFPVSAPPPLPISLPRPTTHHHQPLATPNGSPVTSLFGRSSPLAPSPAGVSASPHSPLPLPPPPPFLFPPLSSPPLPLPLPLPSPPLPSPPSQLATPNGSPGKGRGGQRGSGAGAAETNRESAEVVCEVGKRGKRKEIGGMDGCVTVGAWADAHAAAVTGVVVVVRGRGLAALYSCSQASRTDPSSLRRPPRPCSDTLACHAIAIPGYSPLPSLPPSPRSQDFVKSVGSASSRTDPSDFVGCHGLACSPNRLLIATVRDMAQHLKNDMYTKSFKAAVQLFWIAGQRLNPTTSPAAAPAAAPSASAASPMHTITSPNPPPEPLISHLLRCWGVPRRGKGATARRAREMVAWEQALRSSLCRLLNSGCFCCPSSCCCSCSCTRLQLRPSPFLLWDLLASLLSLAKQAASLPTTAAAASSTTPSSSTVLPSASLTASLCSPLSLLISLLLSELVWQQGTQEGEEEQLRVGVGRWSQVQQVQEGLRRMQKELQQRLALSVMVTAALCHGEERGNEMEGAERNEVGGGEVAGREAAGGEAAAGANKAAKGCMVQAAIDSCQWVLSQTTHTTTTAAAAATGGGDASSVGLNKATQEQTATEPTVLVHPLLTACAHAFAHWSGITTPATLPTPHHIPLCPVTLKPIEATQPAWHCLSCSRWISPEGMHCLDACRPLFLPPGSQNFWVRAEAWAERLKEATERTEAAEASGISGEAAANQLLPACMREMEATGEGKWVRGEEVTAAAAATTTMPVCPYCGVQVVAPTSCTLLSPSLV
ncbi:unnamed protein product, partial [Closterium sp. Naga37s-1]